MPRCVLAVGTAATLTLAYPLAVPQAQAAPALGQDGSSPHVTTRARNAGIDRVGEAYMGWSLRAQSGLAAPNQRTQGLLRPATAAPATSNPRGVDVSAWNSGVDWASLAKSGTRFAFVKATEGNYYTSSTFQTQYDDAANAGLIHGSYHFANPSVSSGADQARYFVQHGGAWSPGGETLPGVLDIEYDPYGPTCYNKTTTQMTDWIASFTDEYQSLTGRQAIIYTTYGWWKKCTGDTNRFATTNPLWVARYQATAGTLPGNWPTYTFWQYDATSIDQDVFNGSMSRLRDLADPTPPPPQRPKQLRVLHYGMTGADVRYAQELLNRDGDHLATDGVFGPATLQAVKAFQRSVHISVDGVVGPVTWSHLAPGEGGGTASPPSDPPPQRPKQLRVLHYGMTGTDVRYAQELLNRHGDHLATDGVFGPATLRAVKTFQRDVHISVDGVIGPVTWSHLASGGSGGGTTCAPVPAPKQLRLVHYGMSGSDVRYAQELLNRDGDHLATDGVFGPATLRAVKTFQRGAHISVDGVVGPVTWSHLRSAAANAC